MSNFDSLLFYTHRPPVVMTKGEGMTLWDENGKAYLDFLAGWAVNALGHCPPAVALALAKQSTALVNASPAFYNRPMIDYANLLTSRSGLDRAFFTSTGAEANESAIKLARKYGRAKKNNAHHIITTLRGFHGRTLATMSATGKPGWGDMFAPQVSGFSHVPFNDLAAIEQSITKETCAVMLELIQGEGGVYVADNDYVHGLRALCNEHDVLLIVDEVQTGFGRTGTLFACDSYGVRPDIMTLGKGIGAGFPLSAMLAIESLNIFEPGDQGGTYTGQPLAMAVGCAVLMEIEEKALCKHAQKMGDLIKNKLHALADDFPISNIRGKGLMIGFDVPEGIAQTVVDDCRDRGLLINAPSTSSLRMVPALIVSPNDIDCAFSILKESLISFDLNVPLLS